jgi:hypothetical protein
LPVDQPVTETPIVFPDADARPSTIAVPEKLTDEERAAFALNCRCCS